MLLSPGRTTGGYSFEPGRRSAGGLRSRGAAARSVPVDEDDARDEESHPYGEEVGQRHVVRELLPRALQRGVFGEGGIAMSAAVVVVVVPAALLQGVVGVIAIIHHSVCKIALGQTQKSKNVRRILPNQSKRLVFGKRRLKRRPYRSGEELQAGEGGPACSGNGRKQHLRQHQERPRHQAQEEVEEEQSSDEDEVREDAGTEAAAHSLERHLPRLEGVEEGEPAVPALPERLNGRSKAERGSQNTENTRHLLQK